MCPLLVKAEQCPVVGMSHLRGSTLSGHEDRFLVLAAVCEPHRHERGCADPAPGSFRPQPSFQTPTLQRVAGLAGAVFGV